MKTTLRKIARYSLVLFIPVMLGTMTSCQEDIQDPFSAQPGKVVPPPKKS